MLNRLTVSALLKAVIAITSACVVIALSLTAYESWDRLKTANRISQIAGASADLFKAMHNLRTDRSTTTRLLNATEPMDAEIEKYLRGLRDAQMPAMARALELLPTMDFPQSGTLVPELARLYKLLSEEQKQFWEEVAKAKDQRRAGLPKEYMETTQGLLETLDKLSNVLAATVNHQDALIDQLLSIKQNAWLLRNTGGEASLVISTGLAAGKIAPEARYNYTQHVGGTAAMWKALELSTSGMQLPPALASAMAAAKTAYFEPQYLTLRDRLADTLAKAEKAEMTSVEPADGRPPRERCRRGGSRARRRQGPYAGATRLRAARADRAAWIADARHRSRRRCDHAGQPPGHHPAQHHPRRHAEGRRRRPCRRQRLSRSPG